MLHEIPSLSRLLDVSLKVEVVDGPVTTRDHTLHLSFAIPSDEYANMTGDEIDTLYFRPAIKALAEKINEMGDVRAAELPLPKGDEYQAWQCNNGRIPVMLFVVRRGSGVAGDPDRHQFVLSILVEPA